MKNLQIKIFIYNLYLLVITKGNYTLGIIEMQINNILIFGNAKFLTRKQMKIDKAGFLTKLAQILNPTSPLTFNNYIIIINNKSLYMLQKG